MKIGRVRMYGKRNTRGVQFGFLESVDRTEADIYFNEKSIDRSSRLGELFPEGHYAVYRERQFDNGVSAFGVKLLEELDQRALDRLYQECREQGRTAELVILAKTAPALFEQEPLDFFLPYLDHSAMRTIFLRRCDGLDAEELNAALGEHRNEPELKALLIQVCPTLYLDRDPMEYFPYLDHHKVSQLFSERCQQGWFDCSVGRAYGQFLAESGNILLSERSQTLFQALDLERESVEDLVFLIQQVSARNYSAAALLERKPELLWTSPEICASTPQWEIERHLPLEQLIQTDEQLAFLARHAKPEVWSYIINCPLPADLLLRCKEAMACIKDSQAIAFVAQIDWTDTSEANLERWQPLLSSLSMRCPGAVASAAAALRDQDMALNLCWWKRLSDSMKIRLLIYLSNFKEELQANPSALAEIHKWESGADNQLLCAVLRYLVTIYTTNPRQQQTEFLKAHHMLMEYITNCFTQGLDVTPGLASLLERCRDPHFDTQYFCEARNWRHKDSETTDIFCPKKRRKCSCISELTAPTADYKKQFFMDFLLNLGDLPDLRAIGIREREEYPFRVSAYVNSLVQLRPHMKCQFCGELFHPKFEYARLKNARLSINRFDCSKAQSHTGKHDSNVYLNFCYHCNKIIDSRECLHREREPDGGQFLCMHCGGAQDTEPGTVCPNCTTRDPKQLELRGKSRIICRACGYDSAHFVSKMETGAIPAQNQ